MKILHFADAHIDMANYGRHDPESGLPLRVLDFLKSLDTIVDAAVAEKVDLVIFAGDAYKDRAPAPTFQREWGRRIMRLSQARIPTLLLIGNHDLSPAIGRAHAVQEFDTLQVPFVRVLQAPELLGPKQLWGLPLQVIGLPWVARSALMASIEISAANSGELYANLESRISEVVATLVAEADPSLPLILAAHASVQGAKYGSERTVMLGNDLVLPPALVKNPRFDYVALGHIHKPQNLNEEAHPPVVYPGSIERVDFGEAADEKFFVVAEVNRGKTLVEWRQLTGVRTFIDRHVLIATDEGVTDALQAALPPQEQLTDAIVRLTVEYPREFDALIDEAALRKYAARAFEFHVVKRPQIERRIRLPADRSVGSLSPLDLLELYWRASHTEGTEELLRLAAQIIQDEAASTDES
jgi:exonuclease SbcD